jgi:HAD superfamily hydrolase (TIGR01509 family)
MMKQTGKSATFLLYFCIFLSTLGLYGEESRSHTVPITKPIIFSALEGQRWVEKCVQRHPEILWLADASVRKTEEGKESLEGTYSEQFFGRKYVEFDRTIMTLYCLKLILNGSDNSYHAFTAAQPAEAKLTRESFHVLHLQGLSLLKSKWKGMSELQIAHAMETALVLGDIGKSEKARGIFKPYGAAAPDQDDFYGEAMHIMQSHPELCSSFARLPSLAKKLLIKVANLAHYGHVTHLEGGAGMFSKLKKSQIPMLDPIALSFDLFIHTCDVAGALGHVDSHSSLAYNELTHIALQAMGKAVRILSDPQKDEWDAYNAYLETRASWLGLDAGEQPDRILARIGAMLRLFTPEEGKILREAMSEFDDDMRNCIMMQLDVQREDQIVKTPTYVPALLVNLSNNVDLGTAKEERLFKAVALGLPFIARVLKQYREMLAEGKIDPDIPLNFNKVAGIAKSLPERLRDDFFIDQEGNVQLREGLDLSGLLSNCSDIEALIFDCDGVLVDTEMLKFESWQSALKEFNIDLTLDEYTILAGHSSNDILKILSNLKGFEIPREVIQLKKAKYSLLQKQGVFPIDEMVNFVKRLNNEKHNLKIKLGLASSASIEEILENLRQIGLEDVFDAIISGSSDLGSYIDEEGTNKPKPYIYLEAAKRLQVDPVKCIVFEDTSAGIEAAVGAGMHAIAVPNKLTSRQDFSKAEQILNSYTDLPICP